MSSSPAFTNPERRSRIRFPIVLGARYTLFGPNQIKGTGLTVNISSRGALIVSAHQMLPGASIQVAIDWPIVRGNVSRLALYFPGKVVRSDRGLVAVQFSTSELRPQPKTIRSSPEFSRTASYVSR
jgi:hypothetical protein